MQSGGQVCWSHAALSDDQAAATSEAHLDPRKRASQSAHRFLVFAVILCGE